MWDAYAQSTQHARAVAWLEHGPYLVWLTEGRNAPKTEQAGPKALQGRVHSLRSLAALLHAARAGAGAQSLSVEQSPASR